MDAEIITIGDEIITGHTVDTNSAFIGQQLTGIGINIKYKTSIGDALEMMEEAFQLALKRAKLVITTGGLGPTDDDATKKAIVKVFKRNLIFHEDILEDLKARFKSRGIDMPAINQNQALLPQGARFFPNRTGSAVGICIAENGKIFISLPGVPSEMKQILTDEVIPYLKGLKTGRSLKVVKLRTTGIFESRLAEMIVPELNLEPGVRLAYLPAYSGVDLRVIAAAETDDDAEEKAAKLVRYLESKVGKYIFGRDNESLESTVGQLLIDNDKTIAVAESCTGGQLGQTLTAVSGSSKYFLGGVIAYDNEVKIKQLGVDPEIIEEHGAVSEPCAAAMALGCRKLFNADYALSITGIAGPEGGTDEKPVGLVYVGLASAHTNIARKYLLGQHRDIVRTRAVYAAMEILRQEILDIS